MMLMKLNTFIHQEKLGNFGHIKPEFLLVVGHPPK